MPVGDDLAPPEADGEPAGPYTPEDGLYQAIVSEYLGFQRAGADAPSAALITAAHLLLLGLANAGAQQDAGEP